MRALLLNIIDDIMTVLLGFLAFIPQMMYFLYASVASLLDLLQYLMRKLAGLDVYYVNGEAQSGDILYEFLEGILGINSDPAYSVLSTIFYSFLIFGVILLILSTIITIIKSHYNYDSNKSHPVKIVAASLKSFALVAIVPIVSLLGVMLSQILLQTLDRITSSSSAGSTESMYTTSSVDSSGNPIEVSIANQMFESGTDSQGNTTYARFDYFSFGSYTSTSTFSGMMFDIAAYSCNRVRTGEYSVQTSPNDEYWDTAGVFYVSNGSDREGLAERIDFAFMNNLRLREARSGLSLTGDESGLLIPSLTYGYSLTVGAQLINFRNFSKFNVGAVWYYYNLWSFNWLLGFGGIILAAVLLFNITFGLMARLLQVIALFLVFPAMVGVMPLDGGSAFGSWRKQYISDILMAFGAIIGMNIFFSILPVFQTISFFNVAFIDNIVNMVICLAGLTLVKKFISLTSKFIGSSDANETGQALKDDVKNAAVKGLVGTGAAAGVGMMIAPKSIKTAASAVGAVGKKVGTAVMNKATGTTADERKQMRQDKKIRKEFGMAKGETVTDAHRSAFSDYARLDSAGRKNMRKELQKKDPSTGTTLLKRLNSSDGNVAKQARIDFKGHVKNFNQNTLDKRHRRAKLATAVLGGDMSKIQRGKLDDDGNIKDSGSGGALRAFGTAFMDFGQVALKTVGKLTGASSVWKQLGDAGVVDDAKLSLQRATNVFGINLTNAKQFRTKKQQEDFDSDATKAQVQKQRETMEGLTNAMDKTNKQIADLVSALGSMRSSGRAGSPRGGSGSTGSSGSSGGTPPSTP